MLICDLNKTTQTQIDANRVLSNSNELNELAINDICEEFIAI